MFLHNSHRTLDSSNIRNLKIAPNKTIDVISMSNRHRCLKSTSIQRWSYNELALCKISFRIGWWSRKWLNGNGSEYRSYVDLTSKRHWKIHVENSSILKKESTSNFPRWIDVITSTWIRLSKLMKYRRIFHVEFRRGIDGESTKICPLGIRSDSPRKTII